MTTRRCEGQYWNVHPNEFKLINALKSIQQLNMVIVEKLIAGEKPKKGPDCQRKDAECSTQFEKHPTTA